MPVSKARVRNEKAHLKGCLCVFFIAGSEGIRIELCFLLGTISAMPDSISRRDFNLPLVFCFLTMSFLCSLPIYPVQFFLTENLRENLSLKIFLFFLNAHIAIYSNSIKIAIRTWGKIYQVSLFTQRFLQFYQKIFDKIVGIICG